MTVKS